MDAAAVANQMESITNTLLEQQDMHISPNQKKISTCSKTSQEKLKDNVQRIQKNQKFLLTLIILLIWVFYDIFSRILEPQKSQKS